MKKIKILCGNCGTLGIIGTKCSYCQELITTGSTIKWINKQKKELEKEKKQFKEEQEKLKKTENIIIVKEPEIQKNSKAVEEKVIKKILDTKEWWLPVVLAVIIFGSVAILLNFFENATIIAICVFAIIGIVWKNRTSTISMLSKIFLVLLLGIVGAGTGMLSVVINAIIISLIAIIIAHLGEKLSGVNLNPWAIVAVSGFMILYNVLCVFDIDFVSNFSSEFDGENYIYFNEEGEGWMSEIFPWTEEFEDIWGNVTDIIMYLIIIIISVIYKSPEEIKTFWKIGITAVMASSLNKPKEKKEKKKK